MQKRSALDNTYEMDYKRKFGKFFRISSFLKHFIKY